MTEQETASPTRPVEDQPVADSAPTWVPTGNARVDAAVSGLDELDVLPTPQHADVYEDVHRRLHEALADLDSE